MSDNLQDKFDRWIEKGGIELTGRIVLVFLIFLIIFSAIRVGTSEYAITNGCLANGYASANSGYCVGIKNNSTITCPYEQSLPNMGCSR